MNIIYKINYSNLTPTNNNFSEGLIIYLRNKKINIEKENNNYYLYNKRFEFFINKIYKGENKEDKMEIEEKQNNYEESEYKNDDLININNIEFKKKEKENLLEINKIKNELILFFKKKTKN